MLKNHNGNEVQKFLISAFADNKDFDFFMLSGAMFHSLAASYMKESFVKVDPLFRTSFMSDTALVTLPFSDGL